MPFPKVFILGAPKCGTTTLSRWLSSHPYVNISDPKEPRYFNTDFSLPYRISSEKEYLALFEDSDYVINVEATTSYLCSNVALSKIQDKQPYAKFIICLREPAELFLSLHLQRLKEGYETVRGPEAAWRLQSKRREGYKVPKLCPDAELLNYERFCCIGTQVDYVIKNTSRNRVHLVFLEDISNKPQTVFSEICQFLGIPEMTDATTIYENPGAVPRSLLVTRTIRRVGFLRRRLGIKPLGIGGILTKINLVTKDRGALSVSPDFRKELKKLFSDEVVKIEKWAAIDLSSWKD